VSTDDSHDRDAYERGRSAARIDEQISALQEDIRGLRGSVQEMTTSQVQIRREVESRIDEVEKRLTDLRSAVSQRDVVATELAKQRDRADVARREVEQKGVSTRMFWIGVATVIVMMAALIFAASGITH
jgi:TolA-binding protein